MPSALLNALNKVFARPACIARRLLSVSQCALQTRPPSTILAPVRQ